MFDLCFTGFVIVWNAVGWGVLFHLSSNEHCTNCMNVALFLTIIQCLETCFVCFQCLTCAKHVWSTFDWIVWNVLIFLIAIGCMMEWYMVWQEKNASVVLKQTSNENGTTTLFLESFITFSSLIPLYLWLYLLFAATRQLDRQSRA